MSNPMFALSGSALRALVAQGDAAAIAEIARRASKPAKTVAALKSRGEFTRAEERIAAAKVAKPAKVASKAVVVTPAPAKVAAFTRTTEVVAAPKSAIGHLHNRLCNVEAGLLAITGAMAVQHDLLKEIVGRLPK